MVRCFGAVGFFLNFAECLSNEHILVSLLRFSALPFFTWAWVFSSCFRAGVPLPWSPCTVSTSCTESKVTTELFNTAVCLKRTVVENIGSVGPVRYHRQLKKVQLYSCRWRYHWGVAWHRHRAWHLGITVCALITSYICPYSIADSAAHDNIQDNVVLTFWNSFEIDLTLTRCGKTVKEKLLCRELLFGLKRNHSRGKRSL